MRDKHSTGISNHFEKENFAYIGEKDTSMQTYVDIYKR